MNNPEETKPIWSTTRRALGKTWTIELWPTDDGLGTATGTQSRSPYLGRSSSPDQWIRVSASRPFDGRDSTLLHEILHLASDLGELGLKEREVSVLAENLYAFLRDFGLWQEFPWPIKQEQRREQP